MLRSRRRVLLDASECSYAQSESFDELGYEMMSGCKHRAVRYRQDQNAEKHMPPFPFRKVFLSDSAEAVMMILEIVLDMVQIYLSMSMVLYSE